MTDLYQSIIEGLEYTAKVTGDKETAIRAKYLRDNADIELNESLIKKYSKDSKEYNNLVYVCKLMNSYYPELRFNINDGYFDAGQNWWWTSIVATDINNDFGSSWWLLNPRDYEKVVSANSEDEIKQICETVIKDSYILYKYNKKDISEKSLNDAKLKEEYLGNKHIVPKNFDIIILSTFKQAIKKYKLTDDDIEELKSEIKLKLPENSYGNGVYKFRWCPKRLNLGTSESRVIYIEIIKESKVYLVSMFLKKEKKDLSENEIKDLKALANELKNL